jgi:mono/diheme cytochrome c family protein
LGATLFIAATWGPSAGRAETAGDNYRLFCVQCHGSLGSGQGINQTSGGGLPVSPRDHTNAGEMSKLSDKDLRLAITEGGYAVNKSGLMPSFGSSLSESEIDDLVGYLRQLCGCKGPQ